MKLREEVAPVQLSTILSPDSAAMPHAMYAAERSSPQEYISKYGSYCMLATIDSFVAPGEAITFLIPLAFNNAKTISDFSADFLHYLLHLIPLCFHIFN